MVEEARCLILTKRGYGLTHPLTRTVPTRGRALDPSAHADGTDPWSRNRPIRLRGRYRPWSHSTHPLTRTVLTVVALDPSAYADGTDRGGGYCVPLSGGYRFVQQISKMKQSIVHIALVV